FTQHAEITQSPKIKVSITNTPATCIQNDGALMAFGAGGVPPYSYLWSNGPTTQGQSNLSPGRYLVTATDANGCSGIADANLHSTTPITVTYTSIASSCTNPTGSATLNASGGQTPYTVQWNTSPVQNGLTASNLPAGNYGFSIS